MPMKAACRSVRAAASYSARLVLGTAREDRAQAGEVVREDRGPLARGPQRVRRDRPDAAGDPGLADPRQIDLGEEARPRGPRPVPFGEVVAQDPRPDERVDVQIDDVAREVEVDGLA